MITKNEIVAFVTNPKEKNSSEDEDEVLVKKVKLSTLRIYIDALVDYTIYSTIPETTSNYGSLRMLREIIIKEQHEVGCQTKVTNFFSPVCRSTSPASDNPENGARGDLEGFTSDQGWPTFHIPFINFCYTVSDVPRILAQVFPSHVTLVYKKKDLFAVVICMLLSQGCNVPLLLIHCTTFGACAIGWPTLLQIVKPWTKNNKLS